MHVTTRRLFGLAAALGLAMLAACNLQNIQAPGLAADKDQAARNVLKAMQKGDLAGIQMGPEMSTPEAQAALPRIFQMIPKGEPTRVRLLNWKTNWSALSGPRSEDMQTTHEYTFGTDVIHVETVMQRDIPASGQPGPWKLRGFHFKPAPAPTTSAPATKGDEAPATPTPAARTGTNEFVEQPTDSDAPPARPASDAEPTYSKTPSPKGAVSKTTSN